MKLESCDILPKIDSTVVAMVTIVALPRNRSLNFKLRVSKVTRDIQKFSSCSLVCLHACRRLLFPLLHEKFQKRQKLKHLFTFLLKRNCLVWLFLNNIFFFTFLSICFYFLRKPAENPRYNTLKIRKLIGNFKEATTMLHDSQA